MASAYSNIATLMTGDGRKIRFDAEHVVFERATVVAYEGHTRLASEATYIDLVGPTVRNIVETNHWTGDLEVVVEELG